MMITIASRRRPMIAAVALLFFVFDAAVPVFFTANAFVTRPATVARYHQNQQEHTHSRPCEIPLFMAEEEKSDVSLYGEKNGLALLSTFFLFLVRSSWIFADLKTSFSFFSLQLRAGLGGTEIGHDRWCRCQ